MRKPSKRALTSAFIDLMLAAPDRMVGVTRTGGRRHALDGERSTKADKDGVEHWLLSYCGSFVFTYGLLVETYGLAQQMARRVTCEADVKSLGECGYCQRGVAREARKPALPVPVAVEAPSPETINEMSKVLMGIAADLSRPTVYPWTEARAVEAVPSPDPTPAASPPGGGALETLSSVEATGLLAAGIVWDLARPDSWCRWAELSCDGGCPAACRLTRATGELAPAEHVEEVGVEVGAGALGLEWWCGL